MFVYEFKSSVEVRKMGQMLDNILIREFVIEFFIVLSLFEMLDNYK